MLSRRGASAWFVVVAAAILSSAPAAGGAAEPLDPKALAEDIRKTTGVAAGLCVHLGCGDGRLTAELGRSGRLLLHGLEPDTARVAEARRHIQSRGLYGRVSVEACDLKRLPYPENTVNLVVADDLGRLMKQGLSLSEVVRVLCPNGTACLGQAAGVPGALREEDLKAKLAAAGIKDAEVVRRNGLWVKFRKLRPKDMGEWTHTVRVGADGNAVVKDSRVAVASGVQWLAGPIWPMGDSRKAGNRGAVTADGRNFYLTSHATRNFRTDPAKRDESVCLVARDAFNGLLLWERAAGSALVLVAAGDRVYAVLQDKGPLAALDAATGQVVRTYQGTAGARSAVYEKGNLLVAAGRQLHCIEAATGRQRWTQSGFFSRLATGRGRVFYETGRELACLDLASGQRLWRKGGLGRLLCCHEGVVACFRVGKVKLTVSIHEAQDGSQRWAHEFKRAYGRGEPSIFLQKGLLWVCEATRPLFARWVALDLATGRPRKRIGFKIPAGTNTGCIARQWLLTDRYAIGAHSMTFVDLGSGKTHVKTCARGGCGIGYVAGNGLTYTFPKACACYAGMLRGYAAWGCLDGTAAKDHDPGRARRLEAGPAEGTTAATRRAGPEDWPTFRHDPGRSACVATTVPTDLKVIWRTDLGCAATNDSPLAADWLANPLGAGCLSQPVVVGHTVFVSLTEAHQVVALDADTGKVRWRFTTGGRLDAPPTVHRGLVLVGCRDGRVYCLRARDGRLVWRFRAAPQERRIVTFGQLESAWPVVGGVLVEDGLAYCFAGRSTEIDGGVWACALDPRTGKLVWEARTRLPEGSTEKAYRGVCDMPVSDGDSISMGGKWQRHPKTGKGMKRRGFRCLMSREGLLDRTWHVMAVSAFPKACQYQQHHGIVWGNAAQLLVAHPNMVLGYRWGREAKDGSRLYAREKGRGHKQPPLWAVAMPEPVQVEALIRAADVLFAAGSLHRLDRAKGGRLWAYAATDGRKLGQWRLPAPPAAEGLAAANGRLYLCTRDGKVCCWGK